MMTILAASFLGSWSYSGFLTEPTSSPAPNPAPTPPPASAPLTPVTPKEIPKPPVESVPPTPSVSEKSPATSPAATAPRVADPPTLYRLTDASGQAWEHRDATYLSSFVEARNRSFATYSQPASATYPSIPAQGYRSSRCSNGRCN